MNYCIKTKQLSFSTIFVLIYLLLNSCEENHRTKQFSKAFEIRYVSSDRAANGETDFKGPTTVFNTNERMEYLKKFADYGKKFFHDPNLDKQVVTDGEVDSVLQILKPQPQPEVRRQIKLDKWKFLGYKKGQRKEELQHIDRWRQMEGVNIENKALILEDNTISKSFAPKDWRMKFTWKVKPLKKKQNVKFKFSEAAIVGLTSEGSFYYVTDGKKITTKKNYKPDQAYNLITEIDLESGKYNFYVNGMLVADFVPLANQIKAIDNMTMQTNGQILIDDIWAVGYKLGKRSTQNLIRTHPYYINTFIDQDFWARPDPSGFEKADYDDSRWHTVPYRRYAHGGERNRGEDLYLRRNVMVGDFDYARLHVESVRPSGVLYINGRKVKELGRVPQTLDVGRWLQPNRKNLVAVKVHSYAVDTVQHHMSTDKWSSMFAGLMKLELTNSSYVNDVYAYTTKIEDSARVQVNVKANTEDENGFFGTMEIDFYPWYPGEGHESVAHKSRNVQLKQGESTLIEQNITVSDPNLWTTNTPNLYKITVRLKNENDKVVDDYVLTTGLRTISQQGGIFRINGKPEVLYGPLVFNQPYPLGKISQWMFSPPKSIWVESILETKKMNGNAMRMSVHDKTIAGVNDKRLARIGNQMGIMFMWQTPAWIREGRTGKFDFKNLPDYMKEVRNNPSIVMWQVGNHPSYSMDWFDKVYNTQIAVDSSRLISPAADLAHMGRNSKDTKGMPKERDSTYPAWTASMIARGNMEQTTSYGVEWDILRKFPDNRMGKIPGMVRKSYLHSPTHAWFDFESEETIGMPNWNLSKGKPYYKLYSYEKSYSKGNIGRVPKFSEWQESQAWQALSAYEARRKKRWLDYDGMNWCNLRGGPNTATYMKPLIEYEGKAKLAWYALRMAYQRTLAGSKNVDLVYGPDDEIPIAIMHLGEAQIADVRVVAKTMDGKPVAQKEFDNVKLNAGRNVTDLKSWKPDLKGNRYYAFEYTVIENHHL